MSRYYLKILRLYFRLFQIFRILNKSCVSCLSFGSVLLFDLVDGLLFAEDDLRVIIISEGCLGQLSVLLGRTAPAAAEVAAATVLAAGVGAEDDGDHQVDATGEEEDEMQQDAGEVGGVDDGPYEDGARCENQPASQDGVEDGEGVERFLQLSEAVLVLDQS